jgi:CheY-like chemotaxis protein
VALNSARYQDLLAGRKLLLADDSITIQKVVELTLADEGVNVLCVNNGKDAIDRIEEFAPDVVLADVFMPQVNGYEVCEFIKQNEKLKHIPVMLLVGSFEPFDEAEARRVGADDTLIKPFQSIRRLVDKVGLLVRGRQPEGEAPTAELPKPELSPDPEPETLSENEIEITTADTQPLPPELGHVTLEWATPAEKEEDLAAADTKADDETMESNITETPEHVSQFQFNESPKGPLLLDPDDYSGGTSISGDEFLLDIDLDEVPETSPIESAFPTAEFVRQAQYKARVASWNNMSQVEVAEETPAATPDQLATTQEFERPGFAGAQESPFETTSPDGPILPAQTHAAENTDQNPTVSEASLQKLSPEVIDAIARRAVEQLSEKVVQEIAWEVVPQLAELLIKRQLEEKNS